MRPVLSRSVLQSCFQIPAAGDWKTEDFPDPRKRGTACQSVLAEEGKNTKTREHRASWQRRISVSSCLCVSCDLWKGEHRQHTALIAETADVCKRADRSERGSRIFAADVTRDSD